jgi:hypothetical protein
MILFGEAIIGVRHGIVLTVLGVLILGVTIRGVITLGDGVVIMVIIIGMVGEIGHIILLVAGGIINLKTKHQLKFLVQEAMALELTCQGIQMVVGYPCRVETKLKHLNPIKVKL